METLIIKKKDEAQIIVDCEPGVARELSDFFTFFVPGYKFMPAYKNRIWDGKIRLYDTRTKTLPGGLIAYIREFCDAREYNLLFEISDYGLAGEVDETDMSFINDYTYTVNGEIVEPYDYQIDAVRYGLNNKRGILLSPTASGKSLIIYSYVRWFLDNSDKDILLVVPTTSLVEQMYSDFADYSSKDSNFSVDCCHKIYSGKDRNDTNNRVVITTWQSIYKLPKQWFNRFGMVIGDEAHNFKAKSLTTILTNCTEAEYRFGLTGTLDGTQTHKLVLEGLFGPVYKVITTKQLMDNDTVAKLDIKVLVLKYKDEYRKYVNKTKYQEEVDFIVGYQSRNAFIKNLVLDLDGNSLILYNYVEKHGKPLYNLISEHISNDRKLFFVSGAVDVDTREQIRAITEKEKNAIIVASLGTFSTGINIRNLHNVIFASPSKSQIKVLQSIGRGLRKADDGRNTTLYDLADDLQWKKRKNYTLEHAGVRITLYTKEHFDYKIYEVDLP